MGNREHRSVGGSGLGAASSSEMDGKAPLATAHSAAEDEEGFHSQGDAGDGDESRDHLCDPFLSLSFLTRPSTPSTSLQLPFFNPSVSKDDDQSGNHSAPHNDANGISYDNYYYDRQCFYNSNSNTITTTTATTTTTTTTNSHAQTLFYTFFLSPTASTSSVASSVWSSPGPSSDTDSDETHTTMPGPTYDGPTDQLPPPTPITTEYYDNFACASAEQTPSRPQTAKHGRSFSRWGRRNQSPSNMQTLRLCGRRSLDLPGMRASAKRPGHSRSNSIQKLQAQAQAAAAAAAVPQMSRDEFEALPLAIQRKYFSTLERLRFAQESGLVDGISQHYDDISNFRRRKPRQERNLSEQLVSGIIRRGSVLGSHSSTSDSSPSYVAPSEATHEEELSREQQVDLARRLRASVILDAADEAVHKLNQLLDSGELESPVDTLKPPPSARPTSMDSHFSFRNDAGRQAHGEPTHQSIYDSFRWLDDDEDLDLRLFLDDYHANLREGVPSQSKQRPSFRRHLSISKLPFGRASLSLSRPGTNHAATAPSTPRHSPSNSGSGHAVHQHSRRKSRALSLITSKHIAQESITAIDPAAAHYQDPEARLKLRVYLASPQKFDEAVQFGFPSADILSPTSPHGLVEDTPNIGSFLVDGDEDDENVSLDSDEFSLADPDSPKTPEGLENKPGGLRPARFGNAALADPSYGRDFGAKISESSSYAQAPASSREMTLRMTLTRPDLRAHEDEIYGWQQRQQNVQQHARRTTVPITSPTMDARAVDLREGGLHKDSLEKWVGVDHWNPNATTEKGVMKRIWNRMRRS